MHLTTLPPQAFVSLCMASLLVLSPQSPAVGTLEMHVSSSRGQVSRAEGSLDAGALVPPWEHLEDMWVLGKVNELPRSSRELFRLPVEEVRSGGLQMCCHPSRQW